MSEYGEQHLTVWKFFFSYIFRRKHIYIIGAISLIITAISQTSHPRLIGYAIDHLSSKTIPSFLHYGDKLSTFYYIFIIYLFFHLTLFFGRWAWRRILARETHYAGVYMRELIWKRAQFFSQKDLDSKFTPGVLMSLSASDVNAAKFIYGFILVATFDLTFLLFFSVAGIVMIDWRIAALTLASSPLIGIFSWKISQLETIAYTESKEELADFNDKVSQVISTIKLQRLSESRTFWENFLYEMATKFRSKKLKALIIGFYFFPLMGAGVLFSYIVLFYYGVTQIQAGTLTVGEFVGLQGYILLLQHPILYMGHIIAEWQRSKASLQRLMDLYNHPVDPYMVAKENSIEPGDGAPFLIENLTFDYEDRQKGEHLLDRINLQLKQRDRLGIKGEIGSGKSTLIRIFAGLELRYEGNVFYQGKELKEYSRETLAQDIAYVSQENFLFADSIRTNIRLDQQISDEQIWEYLDMACVAEDIEQLEHGLDTELGEWGVNLSGGQKQRLCLARALVRKPKVLLLDDCLSAVDTHTEETILDNLDRELKDSTVIWVAHRDSTLRKCHRVISLTEMRGAHVQ